MAVPALEGARHPALAPSRVAVAMVCVTALALPWILQAFGAAFYLSLASRIVVYAIAATSLNLVLGYGGMVSFGHAAFVGLGAYVTGVMISEGVTGGGWHLLATLAITALAALVIGAISLRTRGVYFIMITLAFAQMLFYLANSVKGYGGDEGLNIRARSLLGFGLDLKNPMIFYYVALAVLAATMLALAR
ncbi:MAG TPA: branched-chain amino acid ABC transporter permease, partial [Caldimonas sp.]